jgi:predicted Rossmann fold flavoprotein
VNYDVIIIGAGAAGFMAAIEAGKRARRVLLLDHSHKLCEKIRISGGGRCNFTNIHASSEHYISENPHFCKSALAVYTPQDFIALAESHGIAYHEKKLGQLFCDEGSSQIIQMLLKEASKYQVNIKTACKIDELDYRQNSSPRFSLDTSQGSFGSESLVIACGGLSIPQIGASDYGYSVALKFGLQLSKRIAPGLVPLCFKGEELAFCSSLSGLSIDATVSCSGTSFRENILFTHRGLSGPAILQISSFWQEGHIIRVNFLPELGQELKLLIKSKEHSRKQIKNLLKLITGPNIPEAFWNQYLDDLQGLRLSIKNREINDWQRYLEQVNRPVSELSYEFLDLLTDSLCDWQLQPTHSEGYAKAEVTVGGVSTDEISSKTMEAKKYPGLYFVGEVLDVTGWLGGYNLQWAWSSAYVCGQYC